MGIEPTGAGFPRLPTDLKSVQDASPDALPFRSQSLEACSRISKAGGRRARRLTGAGLHRLRLAGGDRLLLCSDGLHGYLRQSDIAPIVAQGGDRAVKRFIDLANERGGKDNITAILVEID